MTGRYDSADRAFARVGVLRQQGTWPGVVVHQDGTADVTFDPEIIAPEER